LAIARTSSPRAPSTARNRSVERAEADPAQLASRDRGEDPRGVRAALEVEIDAAQASHEHRCRELVEHPAGHTRHRQRDERPVLRGFREHRDGLGNRFLVRILAILRQVVGADHEAVKAR
jgi:hypothetical protein